MHKSKGGSDINRRIKKREGHISHYRCPACHYLVEKELLFEQGCPICGWLSPLVMSRGAGHVDVIDEGDIIRVTTELPLVDEDSIKLDVNGNKLLISAGSFNRIITLRYAIDLDIEKTYRNGVLDVKLRKTGCEYHGEN